MVKLCYILASIHEWTHNYCTSNIGGLLFSPLGILVCSASLARKISGVLGRVHGWTGELSWQGGLANIGRVIYYDRK
jgi:hypothetical protein